MTGMRGGDRRGRGEARLARGALRAARGVWRGRLPWFAVAGPHASFASISRSARAARSGSHNNTHFVSPSAVAASLAITAA